MSKRRRRAAPEELPLFDFPLAPGGVAAESEEVAESEESDGSDLSDGSDGEEEERQGVEQSTIFSAAQRPPVEIAEAVSGEPAEPAVAVTPGVAARFYAGLADLAVHALAVGVAAGAAMALGVPVGIGDWPALALLVLAFSLLYWVVPLAFWGQTPGMAWIGHGARTADDEPLTFGQAMLRWLGALLTAALLGLPLLLALAAGGSLSDRLSQSRTFVT